jgi:hypothetical protein
MSLHQSSAIRELAGFIDQPSSFTSWRGHAKTRAENSLGPGADQAASVRRNEGGQSNAGAQPGQEYGQRKQHLIGHNKAPRHPV